MARDKQAKYAERKLRERAKTIAQTERAFAYEYGRYQHTKNLVDQGILPPQDKNGPQRTVRIHAAHVEN